MPSVPRGTQPKSCCFAPLKKIEDGSDLDNRGAGDGDGHARTGVDGVTATMGQQGSARVSTGRHELEANTCRHCQHTMRRHDAPTAHTHTNTHAHAYMGQHGSAWVSMGSWCGIVLTGKRQEINIFLKKPYCAMGHRMSLSHWGRSSSPHRGTSKSLRCHQVFRSCGTKDAPRCVCTYIVLSRTYAPSA